MATTTLTITPAFAKKTAKFKGTVAAGEHVAVSIQNDDEYVASTTNLRLRVIDPTSGRTLAIFPQPVEEGETPEEWDSDITPLSCTLNLNTVQMLKAVPPAATVPLLFVLDDKEADTLFFKDMCEVTHWPMVVGEDVPYDLDRYPDQLADLRTEFEEFKAAVDNDIEELDGRIDGLDEDKADAADLTNHLDNTDNPHGVTKSQVGLGNVDNTSDADKPVSTAAATAIANAKAYAAALVEAEAAEREAADSENAEDIVDHVSDLDIHVTADQKTAWTGEAGVRAAADDNLQSQIDTVNGDDSGKSMRTVAGEEAASAVSNRYTKSEVDAIVQALKTGSRVIVQELPLSGDPMVIYMVPKSASGTNNAYDEYIWTSSGSWEKIGDTEIDLSGYIKKKTSGFTSGNLVSFTSNGDIQDSGKKPADFAAATHTHTASQITDLGTAAKKDVPTTGNASTTQVVMGNDTRLSDARTPTAHASSHATDGSDPILPSAIGAASVADATLTKQFSDWTCVPSETQGEYPTSYFVAWGTIPSTEIETWCLYIGIPGDADYVDHVDERTPDLPNITSATFVGVDGETVTATRTANGYVLGSQSDKSLASEVEAEALRTALAGKMPSTATGADIAVSGSDATKINAALAEKISKSGDTMTGELNKRVATGWYVYENAEGIQHEEQDFQNIVLKWGAVPDPAGAAEQTIPFSVSWTSPFDGTTKTISGNETYDVDYGATSGVVSVIYEDGMDMPIIFEIVNDNGTLHLIVFYDNGVSHDLGAFATVCPAEYTTIPYVTQADIVIDNSVTKDSTKGVKSSGIWSALWGALAALPTGFTSLYDWVVSQLAGKANDNVVVKLTGDQTISGDKTFYGDIEIADGKDLEVIGGRVAVRSQGGSDVALFEYDRLEYSTDGGMTWASIMLDNIAPLASPAFTGTPTAPTPSSGDNSTKVATTAFVQAAIESGSVGGIPADAHYVYVNSLGQVCYNPDQTGGGGGSYPSGTSLSFAIAPEFSTSATYAVGNVVMYAGLRYICTTAVSTAGEWTGSTNWTEQPLQEVLGDIEGILDIINNGSQS